MNFQIQLVLQLDLDLDSARYTCRITNRRLELARSSLTTASIVPQLVIIMSGLTQVVRAAEFEEVDLNEVDAQGYTVINE